MPKTNELNSFELERPGVGKTSRWRLPREPEFLAIYIVAIITVSLIGIYANARSPFWYDETITGAYSCQPTLGQTIHLFANVPHPVLHDVLVNLLFRVTGCNLWAVRASSILASLAAAALLIWRAETFEAKLIMVALLFASPAFWLEAFEARVYALLFLSASGVIAFSLSNNINTRLWAILFAFLGSLLHIFGLYLFMLLFMVNVLIYKNGHIGKKFILLSVTSFILSLVYYLAHIKNFIGSGFVMPWQAPPTVGIIFHTLPEFLLGGQISCLCIIFLLFFSITITKNSIVFDRKNVPILAPFPIFLFTLYIISQFDPMFQVRYIYFLFPCFLLSYSNFIGNLFNSIIKNNGNLYYKILLSILIIFEISNYSTLIETAKYYRLFNWVRASQSMICTNIQPCAFVMDNRGGEKYNAEQAHAFFNFWARPGSTFIPVDVGELKEWLAAHPGGQFLWTSYMPPSIDIDAIAQASSLTCRDYRVDGIGAISCTPQKPVESKN